MSIVIKGMEMPENCFRCAFRTFGRCVLSVEITDAICNDTRPNDCPLISIPESHGRLIDADALVDKHFGKEYLSKVMTSDKDAMGTALVNIPLVINNAPTILPAEEEKSVSEDWEIKPIMDFCQEHDVTLIVDDEWKARKKKVILKKGKFAVVRTICYDDFPTLMSTALLTEMLQEFPKEGESPYYQPREES